jgi:hypothetical protein
MFEPEPDTSTTIRPAIASPYDGRGATPCFRG